MPRSTDSQKRRFQCTLSGRLIPDESAALLRETHQGRLDGSLRPRLDLGRHFHQRRLVA